MVRIGLVGVGFMGWIHYLASRRLTNAAIAAVFSRDPNKRAGDWTSIRGNFGPPGGQVDLSSINCFESLDALLADPKIDLVDICNPTNRHRETAIAALNAGKHVLVEKPIALTIADADAMLDAARRANRLLMVAHVLPFFPEFAYALEAVRSGRHGKLLAGNFKRVISQSDRSIAIAETGGPAIDLHIHDTHFIGLLAGMPHALFSTGIVEHGAVQHLTTQYLFGPNGPRIACSTGVLAMSGRPFAHGYELYFENATLVFESGTCPLTLFSREGQSAQPALEGAGDPITAFALELQSAVNGVATGSIPDMLDPQLARDALALCHLECESAKMGSINRWAERTV